MRDIFLLLFFQDENYGRRLLRYLVGKKNPALHPELVTARERLETRAAAETEELVVLTDSSGIAENGKRRVIVLSGERGRKNGRIFQYQKASEIYRELMDMLELETEEETEEALVQEACPGGVFWLLDPEGGGGTALAVLLSQQFGRSGKCLYLNLTGFPLYYSERLTDSPDFSEKGLGELLFCLGQESFGKCVDELAKPFGKAYMIPPFPHFKDLLDCRKEEWSELLRRLRIECGYEHIVIEAGQLFEHTLDLMEESDRACLIESPNVCGRIRTAVFRQYLKLERKEKMISELRTVPLPFEREEAERILAGQTPGEMAENTPLMKLVGDWAVKVGREWENSCELEYEE